MSNKTVKVAGEEVALEVLNAKILEDIESSSEQKKIASDLGSAYIRIINREEGFLRKILPPETIGEKDLDQFADTDRPGKIITIEPTGSPAVTLPFNSSAEIQYYFGSKAVVPFFDVKTARFQKNVYELMTYKDVDLRKVITDNSLKDMQKEEDAGFIDNVDTIVGSNALAFTTGLTRDTWVEISKIMGKKMLRNGIALLNDATIRDFGKLDRNDFGETSEKIFKEGMSGLGDSKLFGMNLLSTLKADIVNDNVIYLFTEPDYLGKFYELKKPTLYVKRTEDILEVNASEKIGVCIANTAGVSKVTLAGYSSTGNTSYPQPHSL